MSPIRWTVWALVCTSAICLAGCSKSASSGDPWTDYLTAQEIWKNERAMLEDYERLHQNSPTASDKEVLDMLKARFDKAAAHVKACREKLPEK